MLWLFPQLILEEAVFSSHTMAIVSLLLPVALAVSILRYRLWDIDILINRTLVYFSLTTLVVGIYVLIVGSAGTLLQSGSNLSVSLFATGVVAVSFQPLRERLQRMVNRLMYGERDEPYAVLKRLSQRLEVVVASEQVLPTIVETVAQALKLPYAAIALQHEANYKVAASYPRPAHAVTPDIDGDVQVLPLVYQSETVGQFILAPRGRGETFSQADQQLLQTIARQTSVAAYNVRITHDLQRSRERLVTTREEERRRLRRDLHDGLGPVLAAMSFGLDAVYNLADSDPTAAREVVTQLKEQAQDALSDIRRIAYNLRPPALDELGLVGALKEHIASHHAQDLQIVLEAPDRLPPLPAAVEVAVYRIALEAITNVIRHANASHCVVRLWLDEQLCLEVSDDGRGLPAVVRAGIGMSSMRERAAELGGHLTIKPLTDQGGTIVMAQLPLSENGQKEYKTSLWNPFES
jgi:signal transduction histidine kinase